MVPPSPSPTDSAPGGSPPEGRAPSPLAIPTRRVRPGDLPLPRYMTPGAAGADLCADVDAPLTLAVGARALVPTGLAIALPPGFEAQVRPRSGLALRHGVTVLNSPGTIDADYRGEVSVLLINSGDAPFVVQRGERIAQLVVAPVLQGAFTLVESLPETARGEGGYGHTGRGGIP